MRKKFSGPPLMWDIKIKPYKSGCMTRPYTESKHQSISVNIAYSAALRTLILRFFIVPGPFKWRWQTSNLGPSTH